MAGPGRAPKERHTRTRNDSEFTEMKAAAEPSGPMLPVGVLPDGEDWHPQTVALWESLRRSPLLANEPELGWHVLVDTALMHHVMWTKGRWEFASEVRLRLAKFGATPEDRMRLKVKVETPTPEPQAKKPPAGVTDIQSRRTRLSG